MLDLKPGPVFRIILMAGLFFITLQQTAAQTPILGRQVQISAQTSRVKTLLTELSRAGKFTFSYGKDVPVEKMVSYPGGSRTVKSHLKEIFDGDSLDFYESGRKILIVPWQDEPRKEAPKQTIKGRIVDLDSKLPLAGVNVLLGSEGSPTGTITDEHGFFRFEEVAIGRHDLKVTYVGYEPRMVRNFLVSSGKEQIINVEMEEAVIPIEEVRISTGKNGSNPINDLTLVSGRSFSAYEVENIPGSFSDISRTALSFPGVVTTNDGQNHLVIRGNSPKGVQWRLEGIEIPNLNHFAEVGASGGGVNAVSNNMLASSDFLTGAFGPEYGNALSGIFDLRLRTGNNDKHEQTIQVGMIGTELMVEGPLNRSTNTTYIGQYRYSSFGLIQKLGAQLNSVPDFQDLSFKIYHPSRKLGIFSLFGIGGLSREVGASGYVWKTNMATVGISNTYTFGPRTYLRSVVAVSGRRITWDEESNIGTPENPIDYIWKTDVIDKSLTGSFAVNHKLNASHKLKVGIIYEYAFNDSYLGWHSDTLRNWNTDPGRPDYGNIRYTQSFADSERSASTLQAFVNWKYRITEGLTLNTGMHFIQFYLNKNYSFEPRSSIRWQFLPRHTFTAGFGIHSRKETMSLYTGHLTLYDGSVIQANLDLELAKARHYVAGYQFHVTERIHFKAEAYYQTLYDIPAHPFPPYFSSQNFDYGFEGNVLTNYGKGYNKGIEVSLERSLYRGYHFMVNATVYESMYRTKTGEWLHSKYDGSYASNGFIGREFKLGRKNRHSLILTARYILIGGMRYLPIDRERSLVEGKQVRYWDDGFSEKADDYFRIDLQIKFRRNMRKHSGELSLDLINLTNRQNMLVEYWDNSIRDFRTEFQNPLIPFLNYRIQF